MGHDEPSEQFTLVCGSRKLEESAGLLTGNFFRLPRQPPILANDPLDGDPVLAMSGQVIPGRDRGACRSIAVGLIRLFKTERNQSRSWRAAGPALFTCDNGSVVLVPETPPFALRGSGLLQPEPPRIQKGVVHRNVAPGFIGNLEPSAFRMALPAPSTLLTDHVDQQTIGSSAVDIYSSSVLVAQPAGDVARRVREQFIQPKKEKQEAVV